jgi:hypothetical protein
MKHTSLEKGDLLAANNEDGPGIFFEKPCVNKFDAKGITPPEKLFYFFTAEVIKQQMISPVISVMEL